MLCIIWTVPFFFFFNSQTFLYPSRTFFSPDFSSVCVRNPPHFYSIRKLEKSIGRTHSVFSHPFQFVPSLFFSPFLSLPHKHTHSLTRTRAHTHTHTLSLSLFLALSHSLSHTHSHTLTHKRTHTTYTHSLTHTHTQIHTLLVFQLVS